MFTEKSDKARKVERRLFPEPALAERYGKTVRTLQRWRADGYGPAYLRIGGSVFYLLEDIETFEASMRQGGGEQ